MLREAREDRPGDVREGVQSERTSDGETGGVEEDAIGGELFKSCCACFASLFLSPGKRPPPLFFLVLPAARESVLDRRREREREASAVTRSFDALLVLLHISNALDDVCDFWKRGNYNLIFENVSPTIPFSRALDRWKKKASHPRR